MVSKGWKPPSFLFISLATGSSAARKGESGIVPRSAVSIRTMRGVAQFVSGCGSRTIDGPLPSCHQAHITRYYIIDLLEERDGGNATFAAEWESGDL